ncbi:hypothetical protein LWI29_028381 [Acer saccharum]|uniref:Uncharacterized protein n=1 Tax=Acer saccharum TaxID=4024 RepID=A0AA39RRN6_ACESA|nr:hypothetical protein LWI29_028381 [Acer saccharum]
MTPARVNPSHGHYRYNPIDNNKHRNTISPYAYTREQKPNTATSLRFTLFKSFFSAGSKSIKKKPSSRSSPSSDQGLI